MQTIRARGPGRAQPFRVSIAVTAVACLALTACGFKTYTPSIHDANAAPPDRGGEFLKVHMHSGDLYVLDAWTVPQEGDPLRGSGTRFDANRTPVTSGAFTIPTAEVALLETNRQETVSQLSMGGLIATTVVYGVTTVACLADPKSCFGSCPTFYTSEDADRPVAEGFSSSFARALEAQDLDDLGITAGPGAFSLLMRNEALETHAVRSARLRVVPVRTSGSALQTTDGALVAVSAARAPDACASADGACLAEVGSADDFEYASRTDPTDLAAREEVVLDFGRVDGDVGLVLTARQSLVTTYVFYQSLAYAGTRAGDLMAELERGEPGAASRALGVARELGGIEVLVSEGGAPWRPVGGFEEAGPIAADRHLVRIGRVDASDLRVKLVMARGSWRIDEAGLVDVEGEVRPIDVPVDSVTSTAGGDPLALARLTDPERHLVTAPGDEYRLWFTLPEGGEYKVFLDTEGYYYEWMREPWLDEESALATSTVLLRPREALRRMAPGFKEIEPEMERLFWASRFRRTEP